MIGRALRAYPTLLRVGLSEVVAYRAEFLVWILTTNMPLVMLAIWHAVAAEGAVGRFDQREFKAYYLAVLAVRLLTSHYMDDVVALCPRVIVIDRGHLIYDGDLKELVRRVRPDKRISIRLSAPIERAQFEKLATVVSHDAAQVVLSVPAARVNVVVRDALAALPVVDLTIEEPPLEEVMRELFLARGKEARDGARAHA